MDLTLGYPADELPPPYDVASLLPPYTPDHPLVLTRIWAILCTVAQDGEGRYWNPFHQPIPCYCTWCDACITQGWETWGLTVCKSHVRLEAGHTPIIAGNPQVDLRRAPDV